MNYVFVYRAPNINIAWIMQDYFVTHNIDATIAVDIEEAPDRHACETEDKHPCPSFIKVPEDKAPQALELLKQFKLV